MAIRIALQCSEADSHLILSEDNAAARLLTRPGEAIYNDANGMIEGNHHLPGRLADRHQARGIPGQPQADGRGAGPDARHPAARLRGNLPAVIDKNPLLNEALALPTWPGEVKAAQAWLGDAIAIKDPTAVTFRRQSGTNVLLIGQQDESRSAS